MHHIARAVRVRHRRAFEGPDGELWVGENYSPEKALAKWVPRFNDRLSDPFAREKLIAYQKQDIKFDIDDPQGFFHPYHLWGGSKFKPAKAPEPRRNKQFPLNLY
jgi:hypothetical protein